MGRKPWVKYEEEWPRRKGFSKGKGSYGFSSKGGKGRDKGKGKGKLKAAPLHSKFWERKEENENRQILNDKIYSGTIQRYSWKQGWGFIMPDNPAALPKQVKGALSEARTAAEAAGKEV